MASSTEAKLLKTFGGNLSAIRRSRKVTQQELAEKLNMSVVAIAYFETGKRWPRLDTIYRLSKALNVRVSDFFKGL